jgi:uncharacterized damage-inducible protein DinB
MSNPLASLIHSQVKSAREALQGTVADVDNEMAHQKPGGLANPIGAQYAHVLTSEDGIVNGMLKGGAPLFASEFAGRAGFDTPPPSQAEGQAGLADWHQWANSVKVDMDSLRSYAQAVHAATDAYLEQVSDAELMASMPTPLGEMTTAGLLSAAVTSNHNMHCGEIACMKGIHGKRGYPF